MDDIKMDNIPFGLFNYPSNVGDKSELLSTWTCFKLSPTLVPGSLEMDNVTITGDGYFTFFIVLKYKG